MVKKSTKGKKIESIPEKREPVRVIDRYTDMLSLNEMPVTERYIERLCQELIEWAKKETSLRITQFFNERHMPSQHFYRWKEQYPLLQDAHAMAISMLADRREIGAIEKKYDSSMIRETLGMYDPEYRAFVAWKAKLAKQEEAQGNINVIIQKFPEISDEKTRV